MRVFAGFRPVDAMDALDGVDSAGTHVGRDRG